MARGPAGTAALNCDVLRISSKAFNEPRYPFERLPLVVQSIASHGFVVLLVVRGEFVRCEESKWTNAVVGRDHDHGHTHRDAAAHKIGCVINLPASHLNAR